MNPLDPNIQQVEAPAFLATKFEAFTTRGGGGLMASHDFEDIINVLDGRPGIEDEVAAAAPELTAYLSMRFRDVAHHPDFENTLPGLVAYDALYDNRIESVRRRIAVIARLDQT